MRTAKLLCLLAMAGGLLSQSTAKANIIIDLTQPPGTVPILWHDTAASNPSAGDIESNVHFSIGTLLYKTSPGSEQGSLTASYSTIPSSWNSGTSYPIKITYVGSGQIDVTPTVIVVKDGDQGSYIFDLRTWNGKDEIDVYNLFNKTASGLSHIDFYGTAGNDPHPTPQVPEPASVFAGVMLLLPLGASMCRVVRKSRVA